MTILILVQKFYIYTYNCVILYLIIKIKSTYSENKNDMFGTVSLQKKKLFVYVVHEWKELLTRLSFYVKVMTHTFNSELFWVEPHVDMVVEHDRLPQVAQRLAHCVRYHLVQSVVQQHQLGLLVWSLTHQYCPTQKQWFQ